MRAKRKAGGGGRPLVGMALAAALGCLMLVGVSARMAAEFRPGLGDIARFVPGDGTEMVLAASVPALAQTAGAGWHGCTLSSRAMSAGGGSLIVEAQDPALQRYRVHWAGERTSYGSGDCGRAAELLIRRKDLMTLLAAASGPSAAPDGA